MLPEVSKSHMYIYLIGSENDGEIEKKKYFVLCDHIFFHDTLVSRTKAALDLISISEIQADSKLE